MTISTRLFRLGAWGVKKIGIGVLGSLLIAGAILVIISTGLTAIVVLLPEISFYWLSIFGLLVGWIFGRSTISGKIAGVSSIFIGVVWVFIHIQNLSKPAANLCWEILQRTWDLVGWRATSLPPPDPGKIYLLSHLFAIRVGEMADSFLRWIAAQLQGAPIYDPLAASFVWGLAIWSIGVWAGWAIRRLENPLAAILPGGILLAASLSFSRSPVWRLASLLGGALLLLAWTSFFKQRDNWELKSVDFAEDINLDFGLWTILLVSVIVSGAFILSYISPQNIARFVRALRNPTVGEEITIGESLGLAQGESDGAGPASGRPVGELPREHLIGAGPELNFEPVMAIKIDQVNLLTPNLSAQPVGMTFYWRATTYDFYTGQGWTTSITYPLNYDRGQIAIRNSKQTGILLQQEVTPVNDSDTAIYVAGDLVSVNNQDFRIEWRIVEGLNNPNISESVEADFFRGTLVNRTKESMYQAQSILPAASAEQLRTASDTYPAWIQDRYLQLPAETPQRVVDLAIELTVDQTTPYDRALVLETYLRQFPYTLDVSLPPPGIDVADYFLFSLQEGYCDYYATTMVVMARAAGLPARLAIGYAAGKYDTARSQFDITQADAHSWVEIYFPGIGWIEFEPTGGRPEIIRPETTSQNNILPLDGETASSIPDTFKQPWFRWLSGVGSLIVGITGVFLVWLQSEFWRLRQLAPTEASARVFKRLFILGRRLGIATPPGLTPHEFGDELYTRMAGITSRARWAPMFGPARQEIEKLVFIYTETIYSSQKPDLKASGAAINAWKRLRSKLWLARVLQIWNEQFNSSNTV